MKAELDRKLSSLIKGTTPAMELEFWVSGKKLYHFQYGKKYKYYDLASLTKILFTVPALMELVQQSELRLKTPVSKYLHWFQHPEIKVSDLLTHTSGLIWWLPFYKTVEGTESFEDRWWMVKEELRKASVKAHKQAVYSDVGFITLGMVLEEHYQKPLLQIWREFKTRQYPHCELHFNPMNESIIRSEYAPTELCPRRKQRLQGRVHDDNCFSFGGVSTHAGLFGRSRDVSQAGLRFLEIYKGKGGAFKSESLKSFSKRALPVERGDWGLGFMLPSEGKASCGKYFSPKSFGHLGFTGCSLWMDPKNDWVMSIVSNRVYYGRESEFPKLRGSIHNQVIEDILGVN